MVAGSGAGWSVELDITLTGAVEMGYLHRIRLEQCWIVVNKSLPVKVAGRTRQR